MYVSLPNKSNRKHVLRQPDNKLMAFSQLLALLLTASFPLLLLRCQPYDGVSRFVLALLFVYTIDPEIHLFFDIVPSSASVLTLGWAAREQFAIRASGEKSEGKAQKGFQPCVKTEMILETLARNIHMTRKEKVQKNWKCPGSSAHLAPAEISMWNLN